MLPCLVDGGLQLGVKGCHGVFLGLGKEALSFLLELLVAVKERLEVCLTLLTDRLRELVLLVKEELVLLVELLLRCFQFCRILLTELVNACHGGAVRWH